VCKNIEFYIDDRSGTSEIRYCASAENPRAVSGSQACRNHSASEDNNFSFAH